MKNILKKIHTVMKEVEYIQKDSKNKFHNYNYASELAIKTSLGKAFREHGIVFQLQTSNPVITDQKDDKGKALATMLSCEYTFYDVDSGESLSGKFASSGPGRDDKGVWAATTNAIKYILTSTFLIATGDDAESETNHPAKDTTPPPAAKAEKTPPGKTEAKAESAKAKWWKELNNFALKHNCGLPSPKDSEAVNAIANNICIHVANKAMTEEAVKDTNHKAWRWLFDTVKDIKTPETIIRLLPTAESE